MLLSRSRIFFWAGSDYFGSYIGQENFDQSSNLVSEELITKLVYLYDKSQSLQTDEDDEEESKVR